MFERYTEKARRTIFFGRYEANQVGSPWIESEHLLLGMLREDKALANAFLHSYATLESIRKRVEGRTAIRETASTSPDLPLSDECKRILAHAAEEADRLSHKFRGTQHLFLGVMREEECFAAKLLRERGIVLETAREQIGSNPSEQVGPTPKSSGLPAGYTSHKLLYNNAAETLILELRASSRFLHPTRIFLRRNDKAAYEQIGSPAEEVSYESPVTCESLPLVMFNSSKDADWEGVYSYNLNSNKQKLCISPTEFAVVRNPWEAVDSRTHFIIRGCSDGLRQHRCRENRFGRLDHSQLPCEGQFAGSTGQSPVTAARRSLLRASGWLRQILNLVVGVECGL